MIPEFRSWLAPCLRGWPSMTHTLSGCRPHKGGLNGGAIAGIVIGSVAGFAILVALVAGTVIWCRRRDSGVSVGELGRSALFLSSVPTPPFPQHLIISHNQFWAQDFPCAMVACVSLLCYATLKISWTCQRWLESTSHFWSNESWDQFSQYGLLIHDECRSISLNKGLTSKASNASEAGNGKFQRFVDDEGQKTIELSPSK